MLPTLSVHLIPLDLITLMMLAFSTHDETPRYAIFSAVLLQFKPEYEYWLERILRNEQLICV
jgi:hypothetical protein